MKEPTTRDGELAADALAEVRQMLREGRGADAVQRLQGHLQTHPAHVEALRLSSIAYHQLGDLLRSREAARSATVAGPDVAEAHYQLGVVLYDLGERDEASLAYRRALELKPFLTPAWVNLGRIEDQAFRYDEALACYDRALALEPDELVTHTNRGNTLLAMERFVEAAAAFARAVALDPSHWPACLGQASALTELGHLDQVAAVPVSGTPADRGPVRECVVPWAGGSLVLRWFEGVHRRPEWLEHEARALGERLVQSLAAGAPVDQPIGAGLCPVTLRPQGERFVVCVPDVHRDPGRHRTGIVSFYLQSAVMAGVLGATVHQPPAPVSWLQTASVGANALDAHDVVMARQPPRDPRDSGWRVDGGPSDGTRLTLPISVLLVVRPALGRALTLPVAWRARFAGDRLVSATDASGQERLASTGPDRT